MDTMNLINSPGNFEVNNPSGAKRFRFRGNTVDLTNITESEAERLASDPKCTFLNKKGQTKTQPPASNPGKGDGK